MATKKHAGITYTLIGILLPFIGSVSLASTVGQKIYFSSCIYQTEKIISLRGNGIPASNLMVKRDVDFIHRSQNNRVVYRNLPYINDSALNRILSPEFFPSYFTLVPKPGYYTYLFLFKPF